MREGGKGYRASDPLSGHVCHSSGTNTRDQLPSRNYLTERCVFPNDPDRRPRNLVRANAFATK